MQEKAQKYDVDRKPIDTVLRWVEDEEIVVPEIQRSFVWGKTGVRELIDSIYRGYPIGYIITWKNPGTKLRDGKISDGERILIDGQQRITALRAAIKGKMVINKNYQREKIVISFTPIKEKFEVQNASIIKDNSWIPDISVAFTRDASLISITKDFCTKNPKLDEKKIEKIFEKLMQMNNKPIGVIELDEDLDIGTVATIFERVNSKGIKLNQADFAMSKISSYKNDEGSFGSDLWKLIDYFCHITKNNGAYDLLYENSEEFKDSKYVQKISWLKDYNNVAYSPTHSDLLNVTFASTFKRGRMKDLVSLLSGRDFKARDNKAEIQHDTFKKLEGGVLRFVKEDNFKKFLLIVKSTKLVISDMPRVQAPLNFSYIAYLTLRDGGISPGEVESFVRRWFVMSLITGRYSASTETRFEEDVKAISSDHAKHLKKIEAARLSEAFWNEEIIQNLETTNTKSSFWFAFVAAQIKLNENGFLSESTTVDDMIIVEKRDVHHIFPKEHLKRSGMEKDMYNQIANLTYTQTDINKKIGDDAPHTYMGTMKKQCNGEELVYGSITDEEVLKENMRQNCIPDSIFEAGENYQEFLFQRRKMMAEKIKRYYDSL